MKSKMDTKGGMMRKQTKVYSAGGKIRTGSLRRSEDDLERVLDVKGRVAGKPRMTRGGKVPSNGDNKKLDMVAKDGKMVPFYAADGKGKIGHGGVIKTMKKMYRGGLTSKTEPKGGKG